MWQTLLEGCVQHYFIPEVFSRKSSFQEVFSRIRETRLFLSDYRRCSAAQFLSESVQQDRPGQISFRKSSEGLTNTKFHFQAVFSMFSHKHSAGKTHTCTLHTVHCAVYLYVCNYFILHTYSSRSILTYAFCMSTLKGTVKR
jgi:hypothetical protein